MVEVNKEVIEQARKKFFEIYESDDFGLYEEQDIKHVKTQDWWLIRYLNQNSNPTQSMQHLASTLKWRKANNLFFIKQSDFPAEFYKVGSIFKYNFDKNGRPLLIIRLKLVKKINEIMLTLKAFIRQYIFHTDQEGGENGWGMIIDFSGAGLENGDFDLAKYTVDLLTHHFTGGVRYVICVDSPMILKAFWFLIKSWLPKPKKKLLQFESKLKLKEFVDENKLPDFLDGTCLKPYKGLEAIPKDCPSFVNYCINVLNMTQEDASRLYDNYKTLLAVK